MRISVLNLSIVIFLAVALRKALQSLLGVRKSLLQGSREGKGDGTNRSSDGESSES